MTPISPDLSRKDKLILGTIGGISSGLSLAWLGYTPNRKIQLLRDELKIAQKTLESNLEAIRDQNYALESIKAEKTELDNFYQSMIDKTQIDSERQLKELKVKLSDKCKELKTSLEVQKSDYERILNNQLSNLTNKKDEEKQLIVNNYESKIKGLANRIIELESQETYVKELIADNEQVKKLLEIDSRNLELSVSQAQLTLEKQVMTYEQKIDNAIIENENLKAIISSLEEDINSLNQTIILLQNEAKAPKNQDVRLILNLFSKKKIRLNYLESSELAGVLTHIFEPLSEFTDSLIKEIIGQLPGLSETFETVPNYSISKGKLRISIDNRTAKDKIKNHSGWLEKIASSESNLLILGARGTGKSELANNYSALIHNILGKFDFKFIQPKPDNFSVFYLGDKAIKPDYLGFQTVTGCLSAYQGLEALNNTIHARLEDNTIRMNAGLKCREWDAQYWLIDEFQQLILQAESFNQNTKKVSLSIKNAVSLGRSLKVYVLAIGQVPNVAQFPGWNVSDFSQYVQIYLGDAIKVGIGYSIDDGEKKELMSDFEVFRNSDIKYYGLIREMGVKGYIAPLPQSREYFTNPSQIIPESSQIIPELSHNPTPSQELETITVKVLSASHPVPSHSVPPLKTPIIECPNCGSFESVKNGKNRKKCKKCNKSFSVLN
ncbi:MAG TPA: hypothetical protein V6D21_03975 [Candidatus Obscuribacterales bacterium]